MKSYFTDTERRTIGANITRLRKAQGIKQKEMGFAIDVSGAVISKMEKGKYSYVNKNGAVNLNRIMDLLGCTPRDFLDDSKIEKYMLLSDKEMKSVTDFKLKSKEYSRKGASITNKRNTVTLESSEIGRLKDENDKLREVIKGLEQKLSDLENMEELNNSLMDMVMTNKDFVRGAVMKALLTGGHND